MPCLGAPYGATCLRSGVMHTIVLLADACKDHNMVLLRCQPSSAMHCMCDNAASKQDDMVLQIACTCKVESDMVSFLRNPFTPH